MGKRQLLSFLLLSLLAVLSCSNAPGTSSVIGNSIFQLSENLNFDRNDFDALFANKRILLASNALIKNEQIFGDLNSNEPKIEIPAIEIKKRRCTEPKKDQPFIFGGAAYLLVTKI